MSSTRANQRRNFDLVTDKMFRNNPNIVEKRDLRKGILGKFMKVDPEVIIELIGSRRPKQHDEENKKMSNFNIRDF